jgi:hypothetical protein
MGEIPYFQRDSTPYASCVRAPGAALTHPDDNPGWTTDTSWFTIQGSPGRDR